MVHSLETFFNCSKKWQLADGTNICIRPIRPEDAEKFLRGEILANNHNMKQLAINMNFSIRPDSDKNLFIAEKKMYE